MVQFSQLQPILSRKKGGRACCFSSALTLQIVKARFSQSQSRTETNPSFRGSTISETKPHVQQRSIKIHPNLICLASGSCKSAGTCDIQRGPHLSSRQYIKTLRILKRNKGPRNNVAENRQDFVNLGLTWRTVRIRGWCSLLRI